MARLADLNNRALLIQHFALAGAVVALGLGFWAPWAAATDVNSPHQSAEPNNSSHQATNTKSSLSQPVETNNITTPTEHNKSDALFAAADVAESYDPNGFDHSSDTVDVVEVSGSLDGIVADFIERSIDISAARGSLALVLQVNSTRSVIDDQRLIALADHIRTSAVPVTMWIGPSNAEAKGPIGQLAGVVDDLALASGAKLGDLGPPILSPEHLSETFEAAYAEMEDETISWERAIELGLAREAPTLPFFVLDLPGFRADIDTSGSEPVRVPVSRVRFFKLSLIDQFMHTAASPAVTYLLLLAGGVLLAFELYTGGVGLAGVVGAVSFMLGCYGLAAGQPVRVWAVILLLVAWFGYCVDIQIGVPRVWTGIATTCLIVGSLWLFVGGLLSWITLLAGIGGVSLAMVAGMPAMVRARFSTPTIGREWMIGSGGFARDVVDPEGVVMIDGAPWRARTHRATPIAKDDPVRVTAIEGLTLTVTPDNSDNSDDAHAPDDARE